MSGFILLKSNCPICGGIRNGKKKNDCKSSNELIHCYSHNDPPIGWVHVGESGIGQSMYAPARGDDHDPEKHRAELARLRAQHKAEQEKKRLQLPTIGDRHQKILKFKAELTESQTADLLRRGLTEDEINFALSQHWLFAAKGGYGIAAVDSVTGLLCGAQRALDDRSERKYDWGIFTGQNQLKETGENPLAVWQSPNSDPSKPYEIEFCEGYLKSLIRAQIRQRKNPQVIVIGAAGGIFGDKALRRVLSVFPEPKKLTLLVDADSQNLKKKNLYSGYKNLVKVVQSVYGDRCTSLQLKFADWGQWRDKSKGDCDEYFGRYKRRSPYQWLKFFDFEETRKRAKKRLGISDQLSPDITITPEQFWALTPDKLDQLTNGARDVFINGYRGLGKTKIAAILTKIWERMIAPYHRLSLARNGGGRVGCTYRTDCDTIKGQLIGSDGFVNKIAYCNEGYPFLIRQINSLLNEGAGAFVDEIDQQIKNLLMSSTHGKAGRRRLHWEGFWKGLTRAEKTLSVSADITDYEVQSFQRQTGRKPFVIKVQGQQKQRIDTVFEDSAEWWAKFLQLRFEGKRIIVVCSRKSDTEFFKHAFGAIAIHADNAKEYREFLDNPDPWLEQHKPQLLVVSPILGTGFSIEGDHFDCVFGLFHADNLTGKDLMQFLDRYRPNMPRFIWCEETNHQYDQLTPESIFSRRLAQAKASIIENEQSWVLKDDAYFHYVAERNWSLAHLRADLLARLERDTETVIYQYCSLSQSKITDINRQVSELRKAFREADHLKTYEAANITSDEAKLYREDEKNLTEDQRRSLRKFELADWKTIAPDQLTLEDIKRDRKGKRRKSLEKLEMQAFPQIAESLDNASIERQIKHGISQQDISHHTNRVHALEAIGIGAALDLVLSGAEWNKDHPIVKATVEKLRSERDKLKLMGVALTCGLHASDNAYFGALLKTFDLRTKRHRRRGTYELCSEDLELTKADLIARLPRNAEKFGELTVNPENQWVQGIYGRSTPFENINKRGCGSSQLPLLDIPESPPPEPETTPPAQPEPVAIAPETPPEILEATQTAIIALAKGDREPLKSLIHRLGNFAVIRKAAWELEQYCGGRGFLHALTRLWMFAPAH